VVRDGLALQYACDSIKRDKVIAAIGQNTSAFKYADDSFKRDIK